MKNHTVNKTSEMCIKKCLEEYDKRPKPLNETFSEIPTKEINGYTFHISNMSTEDFCKKYKLKSIDDIKWT